MLERFISPYLFALTTCHLQGDICFYPGQIGAPPSSSPNYKICDLYHCKPIQVKSVNGELDYPQDEYTLLSQFEDKQIAAKFLEYHYDNMIKREDISKLKEAGVTHVRVPLPHWIFGNIQQDEPWVADTAWLYFVRLVSWCRQEGIQIWPDLHTAPGSQNGFDNSGQILRDAPTCKHWSDSSKNIARTLQAVTDLAKAIVKDGLTDVVTGIGILNEPFKDCDVDVVKQYNRQALNKVKTILGPDASVYMGDLFNATIWNDGSWWHNESNTYLDSHYYHVFAEKPRALSPRQHIAYVCEKNARDTAACCYEDPPSNKIAVKNGVSRIVGEWSASFDTLVGSKLDAVMKEIQKTGVALEMDRKISTERQEFLKYFVQAQMVAYESKETSVSSGWFYWTLKTEGGAFAEWDFLRGLEEDWIPTIPDPTNSSEAVFGKCENIIFRANDSMSIVDQYPDPNPNNWQGADIDDDVVVSHGQSLLKHKETPVSKNDKKVGTQTHTTAVVNAGKEATNDEDDTMPEPPKAADSETKGGTEKEETTKGGGISFFSIVAFGFFAWAIKRVFFADCDPLKRSQYRELNTQESLTMAV